MSKKEKADGTVFLKGSVAEIRMEFRCLSGWFSAEYAANCHKWWSAIGKESQGMKHSALSLLFFGQ